MESYNKKITINGIDIKKDDLLFDEIVSLTYPSVKLFFENLFYFFNQAVADR